MRRALDEMIGKGPRAFSYIWQTDSEPMTLKGDATFRQGITGWALGDYGY